MAWMTCAPNDSAISPANTLGAVSSVRENGHLHQLMRAQGVVDGVAGGIGKSLVPDMNHRIQMMRLGS